MAKSVTSSASADISPDTEPLDISDYQQHQVMIAMPAPMYRQVTELAQQHVNKASRNTQTLSEPELLFVESQMRQAVNGVEEQRAIVENYYERKAQGRPVAKQFAPKLHRVNRSTVVLHLIALGLKQATAPATHTEYTLDQALERNGISYPTKRTKTIK
jgi:hypothetical protein